MQDAKSEVTERAGLDGWCRTAIVVKTTTATCLDLVTEDGTLICRLNVTTVTKPAGEKEWANVDIIVNPAEEQYGRLLAWDNGRTVHDIEMKGNTVLATEINGFAKAFRPERTRDHWVICIGAHGGELFWSGECEEWVHNVGRASHYANREAALHNARCRIPRDDRRYAWLAKDWGWPDQREFLPAVTNDNAVGCRTCAECHGKLDDDENQWCHECSSTKMLVDLAVSLKPGPKAHTANGFQDAASDGFEGFDGDEHLGEVHDE